MPDYHLVRFDRLNGDVQSDPFEGWARFWTAGPAALLPNELGHRGYPEAVLVKPVDGLSPGLQQAQASGQTFDCVWVSLGPAADYFFARYLFEGVRIAAVDVGGTPPRERVAFTYSAIYFDYLPRIDGGAPGLEVAGRGLFTPPAVAVSSRTPWLPIGGGVAAVLVVGLAGGLLRRRLGDV